MLPMYIHYMGTEAYGLVGFFAMLQAWFMLLDMGLSPTMARETARFKGGVSDTLNLRRLLRALEGVFIVVAVFGAAMMMLGSDYIARSWLKVQHLPMDEVRHAIILMAAIIALRWLSGLYRGAINGFERIVWLSGFNFAVSTARFVLVIPVFIYIGVSPTTFFSYQLVIAVIETAVLIAQTYHLMPKVNMGKRIPWEWEPIRGVLKFSLSIAFAGSLWILVTQTDKLLLSKLLSLSDYAYFTIAVLGASGVGIISGPISGALLPRLTKLVAEGDESGFIRLYRNATQLVAVIGVPTALVLAIFSEKVLWVWTGDAKIAHDVAPILTYYALGNILLAMGVFPYFLQYAKGELKLHLIGSILFAALLLPCLFWATRQYGMVGAGYAWLGTHVLVFFLWLPNVHVHFYKGLHSKWLLNDIMPIFVAASVALLFMTHIWVSWPEERLPVAIKIIMISIVSLVFAATASSWVRNEVISRWKKLTI